MPKSNPPILMGSMWVGKSGSISTEAPSTLNCFRLVEIDKSMIKKRSVKIYDVENFRDWHKKVCFFFSIERENVNWRECVIRSGILTFIFSFHKLLRIFELKSRWKARWTGKGARGNSIEHFLKTWLFKRRCGDDWRAYNECCGAFGGWESWINCKKLLEVVVRRQEWFSLKLPLLFDFRHCGSIRGKLRLKLMETLWFSFHFLSKLLVLHFLLH